MRHRQLSSQARCPQILGALLATILIAGSAIAQEKPKAPPQETPPPRPVVVERATLVERPAERGAQEEVPARGELLESLAAPQPRPVSGHHAVREVRLVVTGGGRVDADRQGESIAFDRMGDDGRYDVHILRLDSGSETCLTCEIWELRKSGVHSPAWHPSGAFLVAQVQDAPLRRKMDALGMTTPLRAMGTELWIFTRDGKDFWQATRLGERGSAMLDPHFSHEAGWIAWSERATHRDEPWGEWVLRVAPFDIRRGAPWIGDGRVYRVGVDGLAVAHGFTPDDRSLLVSALPERGLEENTDLLRLELESRDVERLTASPDERDSHAARVPHSEFTVWVTDRGLAGQKGLGRLRRRSEVWVRSASGAVQERLSYFNDPDSDHHLGDTLVDDLSWSADGGTLFLHVVFAPRVTSEEVEEAIYRLAVGEAFRL